MELWHSTWVDIGGIQLNPLTLSRTPESEGRRDQVVDPGDLRASGEIGQRGLCWVMETRINSLKAASGEW